METHPIYAFKLKHLLKHIQKNNVRSVLDVGAGDSFFGLSLLPHIENYIAIESDFERAELLKKEGLMVLEGTFPFVEVQGFYDLVLLSQVMPKEISEYKDFLQKAWNLVSQGGELIVVTFTEDVVKHEKMLDILSELGELQMENVTIAEDVLGSTEEFIDYLSCLRCVTVRKIL